MNSKSRLTTGTLLVSTILAINSQSAPVHAILPVHDGGGGAMVSGNSAIQNFYNNPIVSSVTVSIANKATNTPTVVSSVVTATRDSGGITQLIPTAIVAVRIYAVPVTMGILAFFMGMANG